SRSIRTEGGGERRARYWPFVKAMLATARGTDPNPKGRTIMSAIASAEMQAKMKAAREKLDAHARAIVEWHFSPETGTPFWLEHAKKLDFDPRKDIRTYDDLDKFGSFEDEWLRGGPVRRWVPKGLAGKPIYTFETGGSTGVPKSRIASEDFRIDYEM